MLPFVGIFLLLVIYLRFFVKEKGETTENCLIISIMISLMKKKKKTEIYYSTDDRFSFQLAHEI